MHLLSPPKPATLTIPEASRALGISPSHGYGLAQAGKFPCRTLRLGRRVVVPTSEVEQLLGQARSAFRADAAGLSMELCQDCALALNLAKRATEAFSTYPRAVAQQQARTLMEAATDMASRLSATLPAQLVENMQRYLDLATQAVRQQYQESGMRGDA